MKLAKSLLLASAAGLASVAGAQAADLPVRKAAPVVAVDYVRVCSTYGTGYFVIPGTEGCLRVSGRVRVDALFRERFSDVEDRFGFHIRGRVQLEHRQATSFGLLRTVVRAEIRRNTGTPATDELGSGRRLADDARIAQAYIQFGGLTAGRTTSFFSNPDLPTGHMGTLRFDDAPDIALIAYTFDFGGGFSASLSLEDPQDRKQLGLALTTTPVGFTELTRSNVGGSDYPDVVGNLKWKGTWGTFQIAGALHQVTFQGHAGTPAFGSDDELGYAVRADGAINLPSWGPSTALWAAATYADGALSYVTGSTSPSAAGGAIGIGGGLTTLGGEFGLPVADAVIDANGNLDTTTAWSIAGGLRHAFSPQFRTNIFGSYLRVEYGQGASAVIAAGPFAGARTGFVDFDEWRVGANLFYTPVPGLDLGVEVIYANVDPRGSVVVRGPGPFDVDRVRGSDNFFEGRIRIQRDF